MTPWECPLLQLCAEPEPFHQNHLGQSRQGATVARENFPVVRNLDQIKSIIIE